MAQGGINPRISGKDDPGGKVAGTALAGHHSSDLAGEITVPGDKSISHRALILGALTVGTTTITGLLESADVLNTALAVRALGASVERHQDGSWTVDGVGVGGFAEPETILDFGNSGTGARLMMGAIATTPVVATFTGDASLCRRPMGRVLTPLRLFGAHALSRAGDRLPLTLQGARSPMPVHYRLPVPSAQVKSAILLAGLNAPGITSVTETEATRDHTERMLRAFGATVDVTRDAAGASVISLVGEVELSPTDIVVPGDPSSAAFPVAAALLVKGSNLVIRNMMMNPTRIGLYATLIEMGARISFINARDQGGEPVADLVIEASALKGVDVPASRAPSMIDEYPMLAVIASFAEGKTTMRGLAELRVKESDRLSAIARGLAANGVKVDEEKDALIVHGLGADGVPGGGFVETHMDHRIAMAFLVMGLAARAPVTVDDGSMIATSFPGFVDLMTRLGANITPA